MRKCLGGLKVPKIEKKHENFFCAVLGIGWVFAHFEKIDMSADRWFGQMRHNWANRADMQI